MSVIRWEEPPRRQSGRKPGHGKHHAIADALRSHPGEWALILTSSTTATAGVMASHMRNGHMAAYTPAGAFEATSRGKNVYARYVGEGGAS